MNKQTQVEKTIEALKQAGSRGITSMDLIRITGSKFPPHRIQDVEKLGYTIKSELVPLGNTHCARYTLITSPILLTNTETQQEERYEFIGSKLVKIFVPKQEELHEVV